MKTLLSKLCTFFHISISTYKWNENPQFTDERKNLRGTWLCKQVENRDEIQKYDNVDWLVWSEDLDLLKKWFDILFFPVIFCALSSQKVEDLRFKEIKKVQELTS